MKWTVHYCYSCQTLRRKAIPFLLTRTWWHFVSDDTTTIWYLFREQTALCRNINRYVCLLGVYFRSKMRQWGTQAASIKNLLWHDRKWATRPSPSTMIIISLIWDFMDLMFLSYVYYTYTILLFFLLTWTTNSYPKMMNSNRMTKKCHPDWGGKQASC
jgi:hypothetical protein